MVYVILAEGFEEMEATAPIDILRRGGADVRLVTLADKTVPGSHGIVVTADTHIDGVTLEGCEAVIIPGGLRGVNNLLASEKTLSLIRSAFDRGILIGAICAGPSVLGKAGIMGGRRATCYPGFEEKTGGEMTQEVPVVRDGNVITSRAAGTATQFALALLAALRGDEAAEKVRAGIYFEG